MLNAFSFFMNTTKFPNLTTVATRIAKSTLPWQSPTFLYLSIWSSSYWSSAHLSLLLTGTVIHTSPSQVFLAVSNQSSSHPCWWSSIDSFHVLRLSLSEGSGRGCMGGFVWRCYKVYSSGPSCPKPSHSLTTPSPTPNNAFLRRYSSHSVSQSDSFFLAFSPALKTCFRGHCTAWTSCVKSFMSSTSPSPLFPRFQPPFSTT